MSIPFAASSGNRPPGMFVIWKKRKKIARAIIAIRNSFCFGVIYVAKNTNF
jgi:hypothetical protein